MQMQADLLGAPVVRPRVLETTALGAAYLAGLTVGLWKSRGELAQHWQAQQRFEPRIDPAERQTRMSRWRDAVARVRHWAP
jgi:glycerol kinase